MELSSANVDTITRDCLLTVEEAAVLDIENVEALKADESLVFVEGVVGNYVFNKKRLESHRDDISSMIEQLPDTFLAGVGGGWSFLNLCVDKDDNQWTGDHRAQECLCVLAIGNDLGKWLLPKELWNALPGGVPYIAFDLEG
jgi:hypothetical protein